MATRYNENFKIEVVKAYMAGDRSISEIAADYNVATVSYTHLTLPTNREV